ncbi:MAG: PHP domain-containing protein [Lentisphaerae bacterium]|nr:PHP domain-containing protein [Lentisphaerota bacterium]
MLAVDLHTHSLFSECGLHTVVEMLGEASRRGLAALAITDHGPAMRGRCPSPFYERLRDPVPGVRLLKGMEANVVDEGGKIDAPGHAIGWLDVVLVGLHVRFQRGDDSADWTDPLVRAMVRNPCIDVVVHPYDPAFPLDLERVAAAAREQGVALELNNSKLALGRVPAETALRFLEICRRAGCCVALCSDAHALNEVGNDAALRPLLKSAGFPEELIINRSAEAAFAFLDARRARKLIPPEKP